MNSLGEMAFLSRCLRGMGQIMLMENAVTGIFFLAGVFYGSYLMGIAAVLAVSTGTLTAIVLNYDKKNINSGLYGFSAALVGVAMILFCKPAVLTWMLIVVGSVLSAMIQHFFIQRNIPVFTLPFILVTWIILLGYLYLQPEGLNVFPELTSMEKLDFNYILRGYAQVIFQGGIVSGILFLIGVLVHSPIAALYGVLASLVGGLVAYYAGMSAETVSEGLLSFNAVLCAMVFAEKKIKNGVEVLISVLLATFISMFMLNNGLIQITIPFVAASCSLIFFRYLASRKTRK